jgi:hypothetical protein
MMDLRIYECPNESLFEHLRLMMLEKSSSLEAGLLKRRA